MPKSSTSFVAGKSGNPGGRPKDTSPVRLAARKHTTAAIKVLSDALKDLDPRVAISAASVLLDRGWGKAPQAITGEDGGDVRQSITVLYGKD